MECFLVFVWFNFIDFLVGCVFGVNVNFVICFINLVFVIVIVILLILFINLMVVFVLVKYKFCG